MTDTTRETTTEHLPAPKRSRTTPLLCMVILLAGVGIGAGATVLLLKQDRTPPKTQAQRVDRFTERIADSLKLDELQTRDLRNIIQERMNAVDRIFLQVKPEMQQQLGLLDEQIRAILPPEKIARWEEFYQERFHRWKDDQPVAPASDNDAQGNNADLPTTE